MKFTPENLKFCHCASLVVCCLLALLVAGCKGIPTDAERHERDDIRAVRAQYRPDGHRPELPTLTADAGLSNHLVYAVLNEPSIEAAYYDWAASVERITTARSFPDPRLTFQSDIMDTITSLMPGLMFDLPGPGKRHAAAAVASTESSGKYFQFQSRILQTTFNLKQAYYRLHLLDAKVRVNRDTLALLIELEKVARTQNETGKGTLQDVLRAQIEQARRETEIENLEDSRALLMAQFKASMGLRPENPDPPVPTQFETTSLDLTSQTLLTNAMARNPRLREMEAEVRQAEATMSVARKARLPDWSVGVEADVKSSPTLYRPQVSVNLPVWRDKLAAQLAEAQAGKKSAQARLSAEEIALAVDYADKSFSYRENSRALSLVSERLLPKARMALEVSRSAYLSGQSDFLNVIDAQRMLLEFELMEVEARVEREIALAEISLIVVGQTPSGILGVSTTTTVR